MILEEKIKDLEEKLNEKEDEKEKDWLKIESLNEYQSKSELLAKDNLEG